MKWFTVLLSRLLFAFGLAAGGMCNPARVVEFLDFFGEWDPTLAFVMGGALVVNTLAYRLTALRHKPLFDEQFHLPIETKISAPLVIGSACFEVGWSIAGCCPGRAIASLGRGTFDLLLFVGALAVGSFVARRWIGLLK